MMNEEQRLRIIEKYKSLLKQVKLGMRKGDTKLLRKALKQAWAYNADKYTPWGMPKLQKLLDVAEILVLDTGLNANSIIPLFIYEACNNNALSLEQVGADYGPDVQGIVESLITIERLNFASLSIESENFRRMLLSMVNDIRAILIRLATNLYDLRNYAHYTEDEKKQILRKAQHIYIPFTHRLGLYRIKTEMEELAMKFSLPEIYHAIEQNIIDSKPKQAAFIEDFLRPIRHELGLAGIDYEIKWRYKSIPSIYSKMKKQQVAFDGIYDLFAIRIITNSPPEAEKSDCWKVYSIVSNAYTPHPARLRDWISAPKPSGYESLHTTVQASDDRVVEVQIRSRRMDEIAEKGSAAHWKYKESKAAGNVDNWLHGIREILEKQAADSEQEFDAISAFTSDHIYVLTPAGDVKQLKAGATLLDFAFEVHTRLGSTCVGGKVNNKIATIKQVLNNGDVVEIQTSKNQHPKLDWLNFVVTSKAKQRIKRALNEDKILEAESGKAALGRRCRNWKINLTEELIERMMKHFKFKTALDLYASLAQEKTDWAGVKQLVTDSTTEAKPEPIKPTKTGSTKSRLAKPLDNIIIEGSQGQLSYTLAKCCTPIHGDDIIGFVAIGKGVSIHRRNCPNAAAMVQKLAYRMVDAHWRSESDSQAYQTLIRITGDDRMGMLSDITRVVSGELNINVLAINIESRDGLFDGRIKVHIKDTRHLEELLHKLAKIKGVARVRRFYD